MEHKRGRSQEEQRWARLTGQWISDVLYQSSTLPGIPVTFSCTTHDGKPIPHDEMDKTVKRFCKAVDTIWNTGPAFAVSHSKDVHIVFPNFPEHVAKSIYLVTYHPMFWKCNQRKTQLPDSPAGTTLEALAIRAGFGQNVHLRPTDEPLYHSWRVEAGDGTAYSKPRTGYFAHYVTVSKKWQSMSLIHYKQRSMEPLTGVPAIRSPRGRSINAWEQEKRGRYFQENQAAGGGLIPDYLGTTLVDTKDTTICLDSMPENKDSCSQAQCVDMDSYPLLDSLLLGG